MKITSNRQHDTLKLAFHGRLDSLTSTEAETEILGQLEGVKKLELDCAELEYLSSAGLRVLLTLQKRMNRAGSMTVGHVRPAVMDILETTGFTTILTILP